MAPRLLQNFNGSRALVVTNQAGAVEALEITLAKLGVSVGYPAIVEGRAQLDLTELNPESDIVFIDGDLDGVLAMEVEEVSRQPLVPVIGLVGVEAPSRLKNLINLGATAFLRKPVHGAAVYTALFLGINQFLLRGDLKARLEGMERRRRGRRAVIKAIVDLMHHAGIDDDEAYDRLRRESMRRRQGLEEYCEEYLVRRAEAPERPASARDLYLRVDRK
ncbi:ANTAR domain-containing protein [Bosea sp. 117]|uniref:ANTAR domain-containing response regulator n=1 Tax=Bosea sp. 117 TaxID=1125973 RepID=UPI000689F30E|nr:ANTAR domain-containing protein [Bosea sp. 117]